MYEAVKYVYSGLFVSSGEWIHPNRIIGEWEIILMVSGVAYIRVGEQDYVLEKDSVLLLPPGVRHRGYRTSRDVSFYWIHFTDSPIKEAYLPKIESYHMTLLLRQVLHFSNGPLKQQEACDYLARLILIELSQQQSSSSGNRLVYEIAAWIRSNPERSLKTTQVAEHFQYNPDHLNRLFQRELGQSLKSYIDHVRMEHIKKMLLNTSVPLQTVAEECGFSDYKYFLKFFKRHENMTPVAFRNTYYHIYMNRK